MSDRGGATQRAFLIAGPTASGKSAVALRLAEQLGGTIVNADSMQVYRDLRLLTARPSVEDENRAPHRLFGHVDGSETYSAGRWIDDVAGALRAAWESGTVPILVGGTGLYIKALTQGLSPIPSVPEAIRERVRAEAAGQPPETLHARLAARDPAMAGRLRPSDPQRILRALEVIEATGRSLAHFQAQSGEPIVPWSRIAGVFIAPERPALNARIDRRFDLMMDGGALGEVAQLAARHLNPALPAMRALGVAPLIEHLEQRLRLDEAVARAKLLTRQYAKRQVTFARHQFPDLPWVMPEEAPGRLLERWRAMPG